MRPYTLPTHLCWNLSVRPELGGGMWTDPYGSLPEQQGVSGKGQRAQTTSEGLCLQVSQRDSWLDWTKEVQNGVPPPPALSTVSGTGTSVH